MSVPPEGSEPSARLPEEAVLELARQIAVGDEGTAFVCLQLRDAEVSCRIADGVLKIEHVSGENYFDSFCIDIMSMHRPQRNVLLAAFGLWVYRQARTHGLSGILTS